MEFSISKHIERLNYCTMGYLTKGEIEVLSKKIINEIRENEHCEIWNLFKKENILHYSTDDIMRTCMKLTVTGKYKRIEPINDDSFILVAVKKSWVDWPKRYWLIVAIIGSAFVILTPTIQKIVERKMWPTSTHQNKEAQPEKNNVVPYQKDTSKNDTVFLPNKDSVR